MIVYRENETALLIKVAEGDKSAFTELFHAYRDKLFSFIYRMTASVEASEDVVQDVFLKIWIGRETLREVDNFNAYLFRIARNHAINGLKRMAHETLIISGLRSEQAGTGTEEQLDQKAIQELIKRAVDSLPEQQKKVYTLGRENGLSQQEIAAALNISVSTVKSHMNQALKTIRQSLRAAFPVTTSQVILALAALLAK